MEQALDTNQMAVNEQPKDEQQVVTQLENESSSGLTQNAKPRLCENGQHLSAIGHQGDQDHVDKDDVLLRIDNESFI